MLTPSLTNLLVEARVEQLHRAARNGGRSRRLSTASDTDRSPAAAVAARIRSALARVFDGGHATGDGVAAIHTFESVGDSSIATGSRQS